MQQKGYKFLVLALVMVTILMIAPVQAQDYSGHTVVIASAEYITDPESGEMGGVQWIQRDLGNAHLGHDFVYGDPRRAAFNGGYAGVTFGINSGWVSNDANLSNQLGVMYEAVNKWDSLQCSNLGLVERAVTPGAPGVVQRFFQTGALISDWTADLTQVGFLSPAQFSFFAANPNVLGVAFTLLWVDENGNLTDIDGNGKADVAFREIYYNDAFEWADDGVLGARGSGYFDFPAVAIHEVGHGFSSAHFGNIGLQNGQLKASPRAIMNAIYGGIERDLHGRDVGAHCSNWAQWPNH